MCEFQGYLKYTLGLKDVGNKKANMGSAIHKAIELLASKKMALQDDRESFEDQELGITCGTDVFSVEDAIRLAWNHYKEEGWTQADHDFIADSVAKALSFSDGIYNPLNRTVLAPEQFFDFNVEEPWAKYSYNISGRIIDGYLGLKGTMDLICAVDNYNVIELVDWKSGRRLDWSSGKVKELDDLRKDMQFRLYHYALSRLYPEAESVIVTVVYINDGGPFSIYFSREDLPETEAMIRERFETIKNNKKPKLVWFDQDQRWKCYRLCHYGKNKWPGTNDTICYHVSRQVQQLGIDRVTAKLRDEKAATEYTGGGRTA